MCEPVDPYVTEVADLLKAAGHNVTDTWTEPVEPTDHNIEIVGAWTLHLVWDTTGWQWTAYGAAVRTGPPTTAGYLLDEEPRPEPQDVVREVARLFVTLVPA